MRAVSGGAGHSWCGVRGAGPGRAGAAPPRGWCGRRAAARPSPAGPGRRGGPRRPGGDVGPPWPGAGGKGLARSGGAARPPGAARRKPGAWGCEPGPAGPGRAGRGRAGMPVPVRTGGGPGPSGGRGVAAPRPLDARVAGPSAPRRGPEGRSGGWLWQ